MPGERRQKTHNVLVGAAFQQQQTTLACADDDPVSEVRIGLLRLTILDELDGEHTPETAHIADPRDLRLQAHERLAQLGAKPRGARDELFVLEHVQYRQRSSARERITPVGAAEAARQRRVHHVGSPDHGR